MSKLTVAMYLTLDGVMENPAWTSPYFNEEVGQLQQELLFASDALLLGRVTYQGFAAAWPTMQDEDGFADRMNRLPKFVASTTLETAAWNATLLRGDVVQEVANLKQQPNQNLLLYGSAELVRTLLPHHLIDEFRLMVHPVVLGQGKKLFTEESQATLTLIDSTTTRSGVLLLTYRPVRS
ncbi:dihydrofolate reductase family protein [Hymenobacter sp. 5516J-16]|uniref:Dihydrofolate reductase family protein n=1 Tax=Hymenobacter sublimis TaxID=2933777 RepID=A0ABY4J8X3_9BACT|nr:MULTISPECIES: dihydrofolate reductase family protein [Hymenobacter]UOQ75582.1 dihydrofolate reductase family protein [Hymenobacter sp. 5516J-16]UPL49250.1 dihydrofolate reductase family protein [Hymenobacter sublimis]